VLGQSFGGFCTVSYLSQAPEGIRAAFITGGLPGLRTTADELYRATYPLVVAKNHAQLRALSGRRAAGEGNRQGGWPGARLGCRAAAC
jgi:hypothetical protein